MMGCDILKVNDINPYTETGTFGISWNGGYKPDQTLEYIPPDDNTVQPPDDSIGELPLFAIPPNIYMKTAESRRQNIMEDGIPPRLYQFDEDKNTISTMQAEEPMNIDNSQEHMHIKETEDMTIWDKFLIGIIITLLIVFFMSLKKS